jgi:hypothetical protein
MISPANTKSAPMGAKISVKVSTIPIIHKVVPVTPPTSLPVASNPRKPERNFNIESIVNTNAIISKTTTPASDPIDANKEPAYAELDELVKGSKAEKTARDAKRYTIAILSKIVDNIAYNDPFRKS